MCTVVRAEIRSKWNRKLIKLFGWAEIERKWNASNNPISRPGEHLFPEFSKQAYEMKDQITKRANKYIGLQQCN